MSLNLQNTKSKSQIETIGYKLNGIALYTEVYLGIQHEKASKTSNIRKKWKPEKGRKFFSFYVNAFLICS